MYMKMFHDEVESFKERLRTRAKDNRDEYLDQHGAGENNKRMELAPGVLDPLDVLLTSRRRHSSCYRDWSSDVCSSDLSPRSSAGGSENAGLLPLRSMTASS